MSAATKAAETVSVVADVAEPVVQGGTEVVEIVFDVVQSASKGRKALYFGLAAAAVAATAGAVVWAVKKSKIKITDVTDTDTVKEAAENVSK